jgi:hypothetical protein
MQEGQSAQVVSDFHDDRADRVQPQATGTEQREDSDDVGGPAPPSAADREKEKKADEDSDG